MLILERHPEDNPVKRLFETGDKENVALAIDMVRNSSIVEDCYQVASEYCAKACRNLNLLPENTARQALIDLAKYVVQRNV